MKITLPDGTIEHRNQGILHNPLGPAVIYPDGGVEYWIDGNPHRSDGPAFISQELEEWWFQGRCHRIEGPAVRWSKTGMEEYFINNEWLTKKEYQRIFHEKYEVSQYNEGIYLVTIQNGKKEYRCFKMLHRLDGPAVICKNGTIQYYFCGKLHNVTGPASIPVHKEPEYYLLGTKLPYHEWKTFTQDKPVKKALEGLTAYRVGSKLHRLDGPAVIQDNGTEEWYFAGKRHCITGPAVLNDRREFWLDNKKYDGISWSILTGN